MNGNRGAAVEPPAIEIDWLESGKPIVRGTAEEIGLSLSHDHRGACLCVAGQGPQGCDIAPVSPRTRDQWDALFGRDRRALLDQLLAGADTDALDRAGTRIWAAIEALRKAVDTTSVDLAVERQSADNVLFRGGTDVEQLRVLTFPVRLTRGPERMVALVVEAVVTAPSRAAAPVDEVEQATMAARYGYDPNSYRMAFYEDGPEGQPVIALRFPLTYREVANLSRTLHFTHYAIWIGKLREVSGQPIDAPLARDCETGKWGLVTNSSETRILHAPRKDDVVEGRMWLHDVSGPLNSTIDVHYEWRKQLPDGGFERMAWSKMRSTWVAILGHGIVEARPLPDYFQEFWEALVPIPGNPRRSEPLPETVDDIDLGEVLFEVPPGPVNTVLASEKIFDTTLQDANLVGNLYFGNYTLFQGRVRDHFFQEAAPEYYVGTGERGELRCLHYRIEHLREAMPFERIAVRMFLHAVHERGVRLRFDYFRVTPQGDRQKLAFGEHAAGWFAPDADGTWALSALPGVFRDVLLQKAGVVDVVRTPEQRASE